MDKIKGTGLVVLGIMIFIITVCLISGAPLITALIFTGKAIGVVLALIIMALLISKGMDYFFGY